MEKKHNSSATAGKVMTGVGMVALAAAAAGAVFLYGTEAGKKKRKEIKGWSLRMKGDVLDKMEKMKDWSEESYQEVVDSVASKYQNMKNIDASELAAIVIDMKNHWRSIKRQVESTQKKPAKKKAAPKAKPKTKKAEAPSATE